MTRNPLPSPARHRVRRRFQDQVDLVLRQRIGVVRTQGNQAKSSLNLIDERACVTSCRAAVESRESAVFNQRRVIQSEMVGMKRAHAPPQCGTSAPPSGVADSHASAGTTLLPAKEG